MYGLPILEMSKIIPKANDNLRYFIDDYEFLLKNFPNKFVAIDDRKVVDSNDTLKKLLDGLKENKKYSDSTIIQFIDSKNIKIT